MKNFDVAFGNEVQVWGRNAVVGTAWEELYAYDQPLDWNAILDAAYALDIGSSSTADVMTSGTGAWKIRVFGLDANFAPKYLDVELNGQTKLVGTSTFRRIFGAEVIQAGTGGTNAGDIHIIKTTTGGTWSGGVPPTLTSALCKILVGYGASLNGMWTTPAGMKYRVKSMYVSARAQISTVGLFARVCGANPMIAMTPIELNAGAGMVLDFDQLGWKVWFDEKTDIMLRAFAVAGGIVAAGMKLVRIP
jgi:hypothetical protein